MYTMYLLLLSLFCRGNVMGFLSYGRRPYIQSSVMKMQYQQRPLQSHCVLTNITNIVEDKIHIASLLVDGYPESNSNFILLKVLEKWNLEYLVKERFLQQQNLKQMNHSMITARVNNQIVGYVEIGLTYVEQKELLGKVATIGNLVVAPSMRRKGIGRCLMNEVIHIAKDIWQKDDVWLCVEADNMDALELYIGLGFQHEGSYFKEIPFNFGKERGILVFSKKFV